MLHQASWYRLRRVLLFLFVGGAVNMLVAWGLVASTWDSCPRRCVGGKSMTQAARARLIQSLESRRWHFSEGKRGLRIHVHRTAGVRRRVMEQRRTSRRCSMVGIWTLHRDVDAGWPFPALTGAHTSANSEFHRHDARGRAMAQPSGQDRSGRELMLPIRPRWPGLLANSVFFGAVALVLVRGPGMIRRIVRRHRHRCMACGYPWGVTPCCTECGVPVKEGA